VCVCVCVYVHVTHIGQVVQLLVISLPVSTHGRCQVLPFDTGLNHIAGHELEAALQVLAKLLLGPVQVPDEGLQGVQLPEQVLGCS